MLLAHKGVAGRFAVTQHGSLATLLGHNRRVFPRDPDSHAELRNDASRYRRMARPKQISDAQLLESARGIFLKHGPNVPVSLIARQLGVTVGALFYRIPSKDQLLLSALDPGVPPALAALRKGFQPDIPASHQLMEILTGLASYLNTSIACWYSLRMAGLLECKEKQFMNYPMKLRPAMTAWIKSAQQHGSIRSGNPKIMGEMLLATIEMRFTMAYLHHRKHSKASDRTFVEDLVHEILWPGRA